MAAPCALMCRNAHGASCTSPLLNLLAHYCTTHVVSSASPEMMDFGNHAMCPQGALSKLQQASSSVEDYVDKITFLAGTREAEKSLDHRCNEIHDLYALIDVYQIPVPAMDKAAYVTLDSTYNNLKSTMEEVEGAKEENVSKYSSSLEVCVCVLICMVLVCPSACCCSTAVEWLQLSGTQGPCSGAPSHQHTGHPLRCSTHPKVYPLNTTHSCFNSVMPAPVRLRHAGTWHNDQFVHRTILLSNGCA